MAGAQLYRWDGSKWRSPGLPDVIPTDPYTLGVTKPDDTNCGLQYPTATTLTGSTRTYATAGQTISDTRFECWVTVSQRDITFDNCEFVGPPTYTNPGRALVRCSGAAVANLLFNRCHFQPQTPGQDVDGLYGHRFTTRRCRFRHCIDSWGIVNLTIGNSTDAHDEGSWSNDHAYFCPYPPQSDNRSHNDGAQLHYEPRNVTFTGSRVEGLIDPAVSTYSTPTYSGSTQTGGYQFFGDGLWTTAAILSNQGSGASSLSLTFDDGWLDGGRYAAVNLGTWTATNGVGVRIARTRLGRNGQTGALVIAKAALPITLTDNVYEDDGSPANIRVNG